MRGKGTGIPVVNRGRGGGQAAHDFKVLRHALHAVQPRADDRRILLDLAHAHFGAKAQVPDCCHELLGKRQPRVAMERLIGMGVNRVA